ncbi:hypothetical protein KP13_03506 [Klebsiella pneumoniae subsp. pneumoniae Kp13]|nr:hypothetical protein KP13_03506 [Klebsiella pneumoniae subsp. pneumoniae Kp13]
MRISRYLPYPARPHPALYKINGQAITEAFPSRNRCAGGLQRADRRRFQRRGVRYRLVALEGQRLSSDRKRTVHPGNDQWL